jgi:hypothetical protein
MGQHKPQAHRILANISKVVGESKTVVSDRVQTILHAASVRVRPIIVGDVQSGPFVIINHYDLQNEMK